MKIIAVLPTYNEAGNIKEVIDGILSLDKEIGVVVVDDDSSDGTADVVRGMRKASRYITLIPRKGKRGRGLSGKEGFEYALAAGADLIIEMDADLSHDPSEIPALMEEVKNADISIGSRFMPGGMDERGSLLRGLLSRSAKTLINLLLGTRISDPTSGFRCFKRSALIEIEPSSLGAEDPFIILEVLARAVSKGLVIGEVPICFRKRAHERSKLTVRKIVSCLTALLSLRSKQKNAG